MELKLMVMLLKLNWRGHEKVEIVQDNDDQTIVALQVIIEEIAVEVVGMAVMEEEEGRTF
jgi:hypothetical protein